MLQRSVERCGIAIMTSFMRPYGWKIIRSMNTIRLSSIVFTLVGQPQRIAVQNIFNELYCFLSIESEFNAGNTQLTESKYIYCSPIEDINQDSIILLYIKHNHMFYLIDTNSHPIYDKKKGKRGTQMSTIQEQSSTLNNVSNIFEKVIISLAKKGIKHAQERYVWKKSKELWENDSRWNDIKEKYSLDWEGLFSICSKPFWRSIFDYIHITDEKQKYNRLVTLIAKAQMVANAQTDSEKEIVIQVMKRLIDAVENGWKANLSWGDKTIDSLKPYVSKRLKELEKQIADAEKHIIATLDYKDSFASYVDGLNINTMKSNHPMDYRGDSFPFIGRADEMEALQGFLNAEQPFIWWSIVGSDGIGKSRLAFELCKSQNSNETWKACFLHPQGLFGWKANYIHPKNLLLVIDGASKLSGDVKLLLTDMAQSKNIYNKIRVLLIENSAGREEQLPEWFPADLLTYCYKQDDPFLKISNLTNEEQNLLLDIFTLNCINPDYNTPLDNDGRQTILTALKTIDNQEQRPLFLLLLADAWRHGEKNIHRWATADFREHLNRYGRVIAQQYEFDDTLHTIQELNRQVLNSFSPVYDKIIHRAETDTCLQSIELGISFVIHGRAGTGKSGCIIELMNALEQKGILCLAIKMDKRTPEDNAEVYGNKLGFPNSPVFCLDNSSNGRTAVLILDQMDAVRWTASHSPTALDVCSQMIEQVKAINRNRDQKIVLVFVCRTFDLENDNSIKVLFIDVETSEHAMKWRKIEIKELSENNVADTIGKDKYAQLFPKVKELLRLPQNLYVWSKLGDEDKNVNFTSSSDLTKRWWNWILSIYTHSGHDERELNELIRTLIQYMETQGKLVVPEMLLSCHSQIALQHLLSGGMLLKDGQAIRFVHQSFFDYFSMIEMFERIYKDESIVDIIGDKRKQTPTKRYQLQMLFENLLLAEDTDKFTEIGRSLLQSEDLRFFIKYVFLEVLGQALRLTDDLIRFVKEYLNNPEWRMHVVDAVIYGHPVFMQHLMNDGTINVWINDSDATLGFNIIRSISSYIPDDTYDFLKPMAFSDKELDQKIYDCLPRDLADDSESLFQLRIDLLLHNPDLHIGFFVFQKELIKLSPQRALRLFEFIIKNWKQWPKRGHLYFDNEAEDLLIKLSKEKARWIWDNFMPYLADSTLNITKPYDNELKLWEHQKYTDNKMGRLYMQMIIEAAKVQIGQNADCFFCLLQPYMSLPSLPVHEIILRILELLPDQFSDRIILWFMEDLKARMIEETSENIDNMLLARQVIVKHTMTCTDNIFQSFENLILKLIDTDSLRYRLNFYHNERQKKEKAIFEYVENSYWGELQYYLLSALRYDMLSTAAKDRLLTLSRIIPKDHIPYFKPWGSSGVVKSPISHKAESLSDMQWLKLVSNSDRVKGRPSQNWGRSKTFTKSTPEQFSSDLYEVGKGNPYRIASLALSFPLEVDSVYIDTINRVIEIVNVDDKTKAKTVDLFLAQQIFIKYKGHNLIDTARSFCRAISNRASEKWSNEILDMVIHNATMHEDPTPGRMNVISSTDEESTSIESLMNNEINCVRGIAVGSIASLIREDSCRYLPFKTAIETAIEDQHLAVNFAVMNCVCTVYNVDREAAINWFFKLAQKDLRIVAHYCAYQIFYYIKKIRPIDIENLVIQMIDSPYKDVAEVGARHMANMYIIEDSFSSTIFNGFKLSLEQKKAMLNTAVELLQSDKLHEKSKQVIIHFIDDEEAFGETCASIFVQKHISVDADLPFIKQILSVRTGRRAIRYFIDFINETNAPIYKIRDLLLPICDSLLKNAWDEIKNPSSDLYGVDDEVSKLITMLYDRAQKEKDKDTLSLCLDMWDMMYKERIGNIRELTRSISEL